MVQNKCVTSVTGIMHPYKRNIHLTVYVQSNIAFDGKASTKNSHVFFPLLYSFVKLYHTADHRNCFAGAFFPKTTLQDCDLGFQENGNKNLWKAQNIYCI